MVTKDKEHSLNIPFFLASPLILICFDKSTVLIIRFGLISGNPLCSVSISAGALKFVGDTSTETWPFLFEIGERDLKLRSPLCFITLLEEITKSVMFEFDLTIDNLEYFYSFEC